jgi:predicted RNA binding protein YcfA (HicA-like mRNA interferase family)
MTPLPPVSADQCLKALAKLGYGFHRQKGSHIIVIHGTTGQMIAVPNHKTIAVGTLKSIIRLARLTNDEFIELLKK